MRIGAFEIDEPVPELDRPHALVSLRPWVDVGKVGRHTLVRLERYTDARELGRLARPGSYYDFTRYRPRILNVGIQRRMTIPNTTVLYAKREQPPDFLLFHLLEPHGFGEDYVDSVVEMLKVFHVERYIQVGGVSDAVPHTRPLLVSGIVSDEVSSQFDIQPNKYQGPTSIVSAVPLEASKLGIETMNLLVHLPHYSQLEEDYSGIDRLLEILCGLYEFPAELIDTKRGQRQYSKLNEVVARSAQATSLVKQLETNYDANRTTQEESTASLSPEVEQFLVEMNKRLGEDGD